MTSVSPVRAAERSMGCVLALVAALASGGSDPAMADGKMYASGSFPEIADQRALILFDGAQQVMLLQSRMAAPEGRTVKGAVGWVVPVPAEPTLGSLRVSDADWVFRRLGMATHPDELSIGWLIFALAVIAWLFSRVKRRGGGGYRFMTSLGDDRRKSLRSAAVVAMIGCFLGLLALPAYQDYQGIGVVKALRVGAYDAKVLRAASSGELVNWLAQNGFAFGEADKAALDGYIRRNWLFVTARIAPERNDEFGAGGMSPPLLVRFGAKRPVYPLALTAATGRATEVALHVLAPSAAGSGGRLPLQFAGGVANWNLVSRIREMAAPPAVFEGFQQDRAVYLTKYKGKLDPGQMRDDLVLAPDPGVKDYRRVVVGRLSTLYGAAALGVALLAWPLRFAHRCLSAIRPFYYLLLSLFLTPLAGLLILIGHAAGDWWRWRAAKHATPGQPSP